MENEFAFPSEPAAQEPGMTLRDYFAAKAMQAIRSNGNTLEAISHLPGLQDDEDLNAAIARRAYAQSDAMMEARKPK